MIVRHAVYRKWFPDSPQEVASLALDIKVTPRSLVFFDHDREQHFPGLVFSESPDGFTWLLSDADGSQRRVMFQVLTLGQFEREFRPSLEAQAVSVPRFLNTGHLHQWYRQLYLSDPGIPG